MAWTASRTWVAGEIVTASIMNTHIRDNQLYLKSETDLFDTHDGESAYAGHGSNIGNHTHQTSGAQGNTLDHGLALTGLTDDDHTQYALRTIMTADGDIIYRASGAWTPLAKGTAGKFLRINSGATAPEWASVTREFFVMVSNDGSSGLDPRGVPITGVGHRGFCTILIPQDFVILTAIQVIIVPNENAASMHFDIETTYGSYAGGEDFNVHTETADARDIGATITSQNIAHSISDLVNIAALAVGDLLTVKVAYDATDVDSNAFYRGIRFIYST